MIKSRCPKCWQEVVYTGFYWCPKCQKEITKIVNTDLSKAEYFKKFGKWEVKNDSKQSNDKSGNH